MGALTISDLVERGALFVVNHSGGKDSQAALIATLQYVPPAQVVVIHAALGEVEWHGALEVAERDAKDAGVPFLVAHARWKDGSPKDLLGMVERRFADRPGAPSWPSATCRQCTSDLKRDPITRETLAFAKRGGWTLLVNVEGVRAAESDDRAKRLPFVELGVAKEHALAKAGRRAWSWLPVFDMATKDVLPFVRAHGRTPHWAYAKGNERLSCVFCIMGSKTDLANGARHRPELFAKYVELERRTGYTMHMDREPLAVLVAKGEAKLAAREAA